MAIDSSSETKTPKGLSKSTEAERDAVTKDLHVGTGIKSKRIPNPEKVDKHSKILWDYLIPVVAFHLLIPVALTGYFFSWWGVAVLPIGNYIFCLLYTSPSPRDRTRSRMPSSA